MNKCLCIWLSLLPTLLMVPAMLAADTNAPAVDPAKLAAFIEKWRTSSPYEYPDKQADWPLLLAALAKDPGGPWARYIDILAGDGRFHIRQVDWAGRKSWAAALLSTLQQAEQIRKQLLTTGTVITNRPTPFVFEQGLYPETKAYLLLEAGQDLAALKTNARRSLTNATDTNDWNYGNVVFKANESLGRIAVKEGDFEEARRCLRAAGKTRGSPTLNSFGPDFVLPHEVLAHGTKEDREAVLAFLEDIRRLWADPSKQPEANSRRVAEDHLKELDKWCQEIRDGKIPDDRKWR
jgi:hypothetical protein